MVVKFLADLTELGQDLWDSMQYFACRTVSPLPNCQPSTVILSSKILLWSLVSLLLSMYPRMLYIVHCHLISSYILWYCITHISCDWKLGLNNCKLDKFSESLTISVWRMSFVSSKKDQGNIIVLVWPSCCSFVGRKHATEVSVSQCDTSWFNK